MVRVAVDRGADPAQVLEGGVAGDHDALDVSEYWLNGDGHWDCWPIHMGGHFPALYVVNKAQQILAAAEAV